MKAPLPEDDDRQVQEIFVAGCEITGSAIGGAMGFFLAGPLGAAAAGAIGTATGTLLADVAGRFLSQREKARIGATAEYAFAQIQYNLNAGEEVRKDFLMKNLPGNRSFCEEIFEGVLLKSQREHEERKLRFLGQFYANVAFDPSCSPQQANYLLNLLDRITYQQLVMIRTFRPLDLREVRVTCSPGEGLSKWEKELIKHREEEQRVLRDGLLPTMQSGAITSDRYSAYAALLELFQLSIVAHEQENGLHRDAPQSMTQIDFSSTYSTPLGERIHRLCGLESVPAEDVNELKKILDYNAPIEIYFQKEKSRGSDIDS